MLSALCQLYLLYLSSKGGSVDELMQFVGEPRAVQMRKQTEEDRKRMEEKNAARTKQFGEGLLALAKSNGIKVKRVSYQEMMKGLENVQ